MEYNSVMITDRIFARDSAYCPIGMRHTVLLTNEQPNGLIGLYIYLRAAM